jgi:hypothetical protein
MYSLALIILFKSSPLKPLNQIKPNLAGMVPGSVPFKIISDSHALYPRWPPLLKIEISSNGQNCFILSQNMSKFELYQHWPSWIQDGADGHNFERVPSKDHSDKVWLKLAKWFLTRFLNDFLLIYA